MPKPIRSTATVTQMVPNPRGSAARAGRLGGAGAGGSSATGPANAPAAAPSNRVQRPQPVRGRARTRGPTPCRRPRQPASPPAFSPARGAPPSDGLYVRSLQPLLGLLDVKFHALARFQAFEARHLDGLVMDEDVCPLRLRNEPEALFRVEPLHGAGRHTGDSFRRWCIPWGRPGPNPPPHARRTVAKTGS